MKGGSQQEHRFYFVYDVIPCSNAGRINFRTLRALCAEVFCSSIGVAVHRVGKTVQNYFSVAKIILCEWLEGTARSASEGGRYNDANKKGTQHAASLSD
jgi:hypothetical protein